MLTEFDPVKLSLEENQFIIENVGKAPVVALRNRTNPQITLAAVKPIIDGVYELMEAEKDDPNFKWIGVSGIKRACEIYLEQAAKWALAKGRPGAVRFPSMYAWDQRGRPHWRGVGSDSDQVRTYFDSEGNRLPFKVSLLPAAEETWKPDWIAQAKAIPTWKLTVNKDLNRVECPCGATETFKPESRASYNAARARMSKHLRRVTDQVEEHRELHTTEFGS